MKRSAKLTRPRMRPMGGIRISLTNDVTIAPNAPPMTTATARSTTLPRMRNARKSLSIALPPLHVRRMVAGQYSGEASRSVEAFQIGHEIVELGEGEAVAIIGHDREPVRTGVPRLLHDHGIRIDHRLREITGRVMARHPREIRSRPRGRRKRFAAHRVARKALELDEDVTPSLDVASGRSEDP